MPLRGFLNSHAETIGRAIQAADDRFWDGLELMMQGRQWGGVYVMGYAAEIYLKCACFILDGASLSDEVDPYLNPAKSWGKSYFPGVSHEAYHSIRFWAELLCSKRKHSGRAFEPGFEALLRSCASKIYDEWWVEMRYHYATVSLAEVTELHESSTWIKDHFSELWS